MWSAVVRVCVFGRQGECMAGRRGTGRGGRERTSGRGFREMTGGETGKRAVKRISDKKMKGNGEMGRRGGKGPATSSLRMEKNRGFEGRVDCKAADVVCRGRRREM